MMILIKISLFYVIAFGLYYVLKSRTEDFDFKRVSLLTILLTGLLIPIFSSLMVASSSFFYTLPALEFIQGSSTISTLEIEDNGFRILANPIWLVPYLYLLGLIIFGIKLISRYSKLLIIYNNSHNSDHYRVLKQSNQAFSFFNSIFIGDQLTQNRKELEMVVYHERKHAFFFHSFDLVLLSILRTVFWFLPIWKKVNQEMKLLHEYQVDQKTIEKFDRYEYAELLVKMAIAKNGLPVNYFGKFLTQKRLKAMTNKTKTNFGNIFKTLFIGILFSTWMMISCTQDPVKAVTDTVLEEKESSSFQAWSKDQEVFQIVQNMPVMLGCKEEGGTKEDIKACSMKKLLNHIYSNVKYPESARTEGIEGTVVMSFTVGVDGYMHDLKLIRSVHEDIDIAAQKAIESLIELGEVWSAGTHENGKAVNVNYNLPIKFKLQ